MKTVVVVVVSVGREVVVVATSWSDVVTSDVGFKVFTLVSGVLATVDVSVTSAGEVV